MECARCAAVPAPLRSIAAVAAAPRAREGSSREMGRTESNLPRSDTMELRTVNPRKLKFNPNNPAAPRR